MKNKTTFIISILTLCTILPACNFKFGDAANDDSKTEVNRRKSSANDDDTKVKRNRNYKKDTPGETKTSSQSDDEPPQKLGDFKYRKLDYSMYLIPKNSSRDDLIKVARNLHEQEPKTIILLADDDEQAERFITFYRQLYEFEYNFGTERPDFEFPFDWEKRHIVACVNVFVENSELVWYLAEGSNDSKEKISKLE